MEDDEGVERNIIRLFGWMNVGAYSTRRFWMGPLCFIINWVFVRSVLNIHLKELKDLKELREMNNLEEKRCDEVLGQYHLMADSIHFGYLIILIELVTFVVLMVRAKKKILQPFDIHSSPLERDGVVMLNILLSGLFFCATVLFQYFTYQAVSPVFLYSRDGIPLLWGVWLGAMLVNFAFLFFLNILVFFCWEEPIYLILNR